MMRVRTEFWILGRRDAVDDLADLVDRTGLDSRYLSGVPVPQVAVILAAGGRPDEAKEVVASVRAGVLPELLRQHESLLLLADGLADVEQGRVDEGFRTLERAQRSAICRFCFGAHIGRAYESVGRTDEAIERYTLYLEAPWADRFETDVALPATGIWLQAPTHERLAQLLEERGQPGDLERAAAHYEAFVEMWEEADPELQPRVERARAALARLRTR